ncbi:GDSL-type esterase/lipase family protein [Sphingomonas sp. SRS2]|uniref:GDSL-type esterase/lipase family protein n=1 Tax=Sphingomonas sp. SRS2 TaxID=133190 RepID=UPI0006184BED|nr:GDSL-type esterase/lipase family protein [Sphingomonas sp. SRS2]KKC23765.1 lipolytic enzyme [Sphingomonas sp. SRS2]
MKLILTAVMAMTAAAAALAAEPMVPAKPLSRFDAEVAAFAGAGQASTLFLGSSSIRLWDVAGSFPALHAANRGFGGATTADVLHHYDRVVAGVQPASVLVYVGENDIAGGASAEQAASDVLTLLARLRRDMPAARIAYLSMKPTPSRWHLYPHMGAANAAIRASAAAVGFDYIDVGTALLAADGRPDVQLFRLDGLHLNESGYQRWTAIIDRYLQPASRMASAKVQGAS